MAKLSEEEQKSSKLVKTLQDVKNNIKKDTEEVVSNMSDVSVGEFGSWVMDTNYENIDLCNENDIQAYISKEDIRFENQFKQVIQYFQNKFSILFDTFTNLTIKTADDRSKWRIKEEHYKAEIENLKSQIDENEDDTSNLSPGLININKSDFVDRKYTFLEDSYKQIRTLNENITNELLENKKERLNETHEYEIKIQNLIQSVINLSDKLRNSVPRSLFLKQNAMFNDNVLKNRYTVEEKAKKYIFSEDLQKRLEKNKFEIIEIIRRETNVNCKYLLYNLIINKLIHYIIEV